MKLSIKSRSGKELCSLDIDNSAQVDDLKALFHSKFKKWYPTRQWFTVENETGERTPLKTGALSSYGLKNNSVVVFKDLGPQVSWETVFLIEYFGPILMHSIVFFLPQFLYGVTFEKSLVQNISFIMVVAHYVKRELETKFIHRFSAETMPVRNIFKNSGHYWIFGGINIAYFQYHPLYSNSLSINTIYGLTALWTIAQLGNLHAHITLKNLRPPGTRIRAIPNGQLFNIVSCANYTWEIIAWGSFAVLTQTIGAWLFLLVSFIQIAAWAKKKHVRYHAEFDGKNGKLLYPKNRKALVPFIF